MHPEGVETHRREHTAHTPHLVTGLETGPPSHRANRPGIDRTATERRSSRNTRTSEHRRGNIDRCPPPPRIAPVLAHYPTSGATSSMTSGIPSNYPPGHRRNPTMTRRAGKRKGGEKNEENDWGAWDE